MYRILSPMVWAVVPAFMLGGLAIPPSAAADTTEPPPPITTVAECRDVNATVVLDGTTQHLPARACREGSGSWELIRDDADFDPGFNVNAGYPPPDAYYGYAYDPWFWGYPIGFSSVVVFNSGHFHDRGRFGFHGFANHGFGNHGFHGGGGMRHR